MGSWLGGAGPCVIFFWGFEGGRMHGDWFFRGSFLGVRAVPMGEF